jgi:hypothetical protein
VLTIRQRFLLGFILAATIGATVLVLQRVSLPLNNPCGLNTDQLGLPASVQLSQTPHPWYFPGSRCTATFANGESEEFVIPWERGRQHLVVPVVLFAPPWLLTAAWIRKRRPGSRLRPEGR